MKNIKLWHAAVMAVVVALVAGLGVWLYQRYQSDAQAEALPNAARIQRVDGQVAMNDSLVNDAEWRTTGPNEPFSVGDRIYTRDNSRASLEFNGRNFARLDPNTELDCVVLTDDRTQLALRDGSAIFDVGYLPSGDLFEVGTPYGAVDFYEPGLYHVDVNDGNAIVSVLSGLAQVVGQGGSDRIGKGEMLTLLGTTAAEVLLSRLDGRDAGYLVDDYYRYQYGDAYDGRYENYDAYLNDPFYYDPYRNNPSYQYVTYTVPGINDLNYYGDWQDVGGHGYAWRPRVDAGWTPYQQGYWTNDYPYGLTWVSTEPWGYAPYHYGRWAFVGDRWYWVPDAVNTEPRYSPALVAFVPLNQNEIGWVPLGPGDPYVARYYDENWQPHYLTRGDVIASNLVNLAVPNAVTVVPLDYFGRPIEPRFVKRVNPALFAQVRPTLDPLTLTPLRNAVVHSAWGRGKIDLPPGIAKKLNDTPVVISTVPHPRFKRDLAKALRVEPAKSQKLKVKDERHRDAAQTDAVRKQQINTLANEAARGNKEARQEVRRLEQQERRNQRELRPLAPQGERIGNPARPKQQQRRVQQEQRRVVAPQGERIGNPARPKVRGQSESPRRSAAPQQLKHERPQAPAASKQERKQSPGPAKHGGGAGGGGGKGKKP